MHRLEESQSTDDLNIRLMRGKEILRSGRRESFANCLNMFVLKKKNAKTFMSKPHTNYDTSSDKCLLLIKVSSITQKKYPSGLFKGDS